MINKDNHFHCIKKLFRSLIVLMVFAVGLSLNIVSARPLSTATDLYWPEVKDSYLKVGQFADPRDIHRVIIGLPKREVRLLLNHPNFSEGLFEVHEWDYVFNFLTGIGQEYVTCQYKVLFDKNMLVSSTHWRDPQCAEYLEERSTKKITKQINLNTDGLFEFGKSDFNSLQNTGQQNLAALVENLKSSGKNLHSIEIIGHTDRLGNVSANNELSLARADSVKKYFENNGLNGILIQIRGMGSSKPVVFCNRPLLNDLIACLMPNRRIEVYVR